MPLVSLAAWQALVDRAHVKAGQKILVHAGAGGLGSTVIQLAKHLGATVATTARGENAELVRSLGADVVVDYTNEDFAEVLSGYDVVLDSLGGENLEKSLTVLKRGGQAIGVAGPPDPGWRSHTSSKAAPTARSSSRSTDNRQRRLSRRDGAEDRAARASAAAPNRRSRDRPAATLSTPSADGWASR